MLPRAGRYALFLLIALTGSLPQLLLWQWPFGAAYAIALSVLTLFVLAYRVPSVRKTAVSVAIIPAALMVGLAMYRTESFEQSLALYDALLALAMAYRLIFGFAYRAPAEKRWSWRQYGQWLPFFVVGGMGLALIGYYVLRGTQPLTGVPLTVAAPGLALFAITEELLFRGIIQRSAMRELPANWAVLIPVLCYTTLTLPQGSVAVTLFAFLASTVLSVSYRFVPNLLCTTAMNLSMKLLFLALIHVGL